MAELNSFQPPVLLETQAKNDLIHRSIRAGSSLYLWDRAALWCSVTLRCGWRHSSEEQARSVKGPRTIPEGRYKRGERDWYKVKERLEQRERESLWSLTTELPKKTAPTLKGCNPWITKMVFSQYPSLCMGNRGSGAAVVKRVVYHHWVLTMWLTSPQTTQGHRKINDDRSHAGYRQRSSMSDVRAVMGRDDNNPIAIHFSLLYIVKKNWSESCGSQFSCIIERHQKSLIVYI